MAHRAAACIAVMLGLQACGGGEDPQVPTTLAATGGATIQLTGTVFQETATAPQVQLLDAKGRGIAGLRVRWRVGPNSGGVGNDSTQTDASGVARSGGWTLGTLAGIQTLVASADGVSPVTFTAQAVAAAPSLLVRVSPTTQQATVNTNVTQPPSVRAEDAFGNLVSGVPVTFSVASGGGSVEGAQQTTDNNGIATAGAWKLGTGIGQQIARATATGVTQASFSATALAGPPTSIVKLAGDGQEGVSGTALTTRPGVQVRDEFNNPVGNVPVTFSPGPNSGTVTNGTVQSDAATGSAFVGSWVLGTAPTQSLVATSSSVAGASVTFSATAIATQFNIEVRFVGDGGTDRQRLAFTRAATKWRSVIVGQVQQINANAPAGECRSWIPAITEIIDDLVIFARIANIDGTNGVLGQASVCYIGNNSQLPVVGFMEFDAADLPSLETTGVIDDVVLHEMGHVLGVGTLWSFRGLVSGGGGADPTFTGSGARAQFTAANLQTYGGPIVPVHNEGPAGRRDVHWRSPLFGRELMNPFAQAGGMPLSRITAASLADMGYTVNLNAADAFSLNAASLSSPFQPTPIALDNDVPTDVVIRTFKPDGSRPPVRRP